MTELRKLLDGVLTKHPALFSKIENLVFILEHIEYRLRIVESKNSEFLQGVQQLSKNIDPYAFGKEKGLDFSSENQQFQIEEAYHPVTPKELLFEFNALIVLLMSLIDNVVDLYLTIKYAPARADRHWDSGEFRKKEYANDLMRVAFDAAFSTWLGDLIAARDKIVHRICQKPRISIKVRIDFWGRKTGFPIQRQTEIKELEGFKEGLFLWSIAKISESRQLCSALLNSVL